MKIRKYVKKDIIKATSILILLLGLLTILYLSEIQSILLSEFRRWLQ